MSTDPRIDSYIARQADFGRPILDHLRSAVHAACPQAEETMKWSMPHFLYKGQMLAGMAAFKAHATFGFWRAKEVLGETGAERDAMGQFGRLASVADLPPDEVLHALVRKAMALTDAGTRPARAKAAPKAELETPPDLSAALDANPAARATFDGFPPGGRREYVEWVAEAKRPETRDKRIAQAVEWMAEGKRRNWKYENC
ncbi:MAG TPA: YdeI/OmpD-associated family protein [Allosphingosinicella sp.]